ncbi:thioredoxin family protein [Bremerella sp.]|uniref:thioredoxin family protein n=1 Tax=Bremerella sp. TaxID=2795602 RepID=UPI0039188186
MNILLRSVCLLPSLLLLASWTSTATAETSETAWHDDYSSAVKAATAEKKMLLIVFNDDSSAATRFEAEVLTDRRVQNLLDNYVVAKLSVDANVKLDGKPTRILNHAAFGYMYGSAGVAIIDYTNNDPSQYGQVVSQFNFRSAQGRTVTEMEVILTLPPGSLTQRTLIYAVRMHPEKPSSTKGIFRRLLALETFRHSRNQADMQLQGHHQWESRFHQIKAQLPGGLVPTEVCAESWPGQRLEDAAIECVRSWRHSSGHWSAVSDNNVYYGYDMKRGRNGIWYATGIFARNR